MGVLVSTIFILVGGGIIYGAIYGNRKLKEQAAAEQANPESPWLWRKDWAARPRGKQEPQQRHRPLDGGDFCEWDCAHGRGRNRA